MRARISLFGLVAAAVISNTVVAWAAGIENLVEGLAGLSHPGPYSASASEVARDFLSSMLLGPLGAIAFGFVGAMIFLGAAFLVVARTTGPRSFVIAGASASLAWIACGLCARFLPEHVGSSWFNAFEVVLCLEPFAFRPEAAIAAALGALVAGPVAGWTYSRALNTKVGPWHEFARRSPR